MSDFPFDALKKIALDALTEHLTETKAELKADIVPFLESIVRDTALWGQAYAKGDPDALQNLKHLSVQVQMLGAIVYGREAKRAIETLETVFLAVAKVVGAFLKAAIL